MSKKVQYEVVDAHTLDDLMEIVQEMIDEAGWTPLGGVAVSETDEEITFYQALIKERGR